MPQSRLAPLWSWPCHRTRAEHGSNIIAISPSLTNDASLCVKRTIISHPSPTAPQAAMLPSAHLRKIQSAHLRSIHPAFTCVISRSRRMRLSR
jgi:hypothetical protein